MTLKNWFPTPIYAAKLGGSEAERFNAELLAECLRIRDHDADGQAWSRDNYPGGFTSYGSLCRLHRSFSTFGKLERRLRRHVRALSAALEFDLEGRELAMTDCWVNIMPQSIAHGLHLHPHSTLSGTYWVKTPRGCSGLKFEDPRLAKFMAAPPKKADAAPSNRAFVTYPAEAGHLVLFESWLRHEVPVNRRPAERVSISFNYNWF